MRILTQGYEHSYAPEKNYSIDMTLSENPLGCSPRVKKALIQHIDKMHHYPDKHGKVLLHALADFHGVSTDNIVLGAGANQLLEDILRALAVGGNIVTNEATFPEPLYGIRALQGSAICVPLKNNFHMNFDALLRAVNSETKLIYICNPNNPTGIWENKEDIENLAKSSPVPIVISEAGADFIGDTLIGENLDNVLIVRSLSKSYGLAGVRVGYAIGSAEKIRNIRETSCSYKVSHLAQVAALAALADQEHLKKSVQYILEQKKFLFKGLSMLGFQCIHSGGQTFIAKVPNGTATELCHIAEKKGVGLLDCSRYQGFESYIRFSPRSESVNKQFLKIITSLLKG